VRLKGQTNDYDDDDKSSNSSNNNSSNNNNNESKAEATAATNVSGKNAKINDTATK